MKKVKIKSSKGFISAAIHRPEKETGRLAILCPGLLDSKDYAHLIALGEMLSKRGYVAVRFDPTGTWESSGDIADYNTAQYLEDIESVISYMNGQGKYKHILIGGHSRGGRMSILYAARDPRISLVLGIMPSFKKLKKDKHDKWEKDGIKISKRDLPDNKNKFKEFRLPFSHALDLNKYNTLDEATKIKVPVILVIGELDELIPEEEARELYKNIKSPKKFIVIPDIGHDYRHNKDEIDIVNEEIEKQLDEVNLKK